MFCHSTFTFVFTSNAYVYTFVRVNTRLSLIGINMRL